MNLEQSVCGLKEPFLFWLWHSQAGRPDAGRLATLGDVEEVGLTTRDGRTLRGYRLKAAKSGSRQQTAFPKGYLLVLQGNAILADQILGDFVPYADAGYDVYIYDYRGYGRSGGKRRLKAIVSDIQEIVLALNSRPYKEHLVFAMSFGGIVLLDALPAKLDLHRVVVDSCPSRLSDYGCPPAFDPINHLPEDSTNYLFIVGLRDRVVTPTMSRDLVELARQRHARVVQEPALAHPFMDYSRDAHQRRMKIIKQFLLQQ